MTENERKDGEPSKFFAQIEEQICRFAEQGEGRVDVNIQCYPLRKGHSEYRICAPNLFLSPGYISNNKLRGDLSQLHDRSTNRQAFEIFKKGLVDILEASGFGQIQLTFNRDRKEKTIIFCEITISQKHII